MLRRWESIRGYRRRAYARNVSFKTLYTKASLRYRSTQLIKLNYPIINNFSENLLFLLSIFFIGVVRYCTSFQWSNVVFTRLPQVVVHLITISVNGRMCLTMTENGILLMVTPLQKEQGLNTIAMEMVKKIARSSFTHKKKSKLHFTCG